MCVPVLAQDCKVEALFFSFLPLSTTADHGILPPTKLNLEMIVYLLSPAHAFFNLPFRRIVRAILLIIAALLL